MRSYVLFLLLGLCFFSCEQLKEIIKPTHPKPVADTCRIKTEEYIMDFREYMYDQEGKVVKWEYEKGLYSDVVFVYNEKDQMIAHFEGNDTTRTLSYDSIGRLKQTVDFIYPDNNRNTQTYSYKKDTILIEVVYTTAPGTLIWSFQRMLIFENDNLIRERELPGENYPDGFERTYTYTNIPNRLRNQRKPLILPEEPMTNFWMSKYLPATVAGNPVFPTVQLTFQLNEQGYPINDGAFSGVEYTYECEK
jgi:hypothetical protein